MFRSESSLAHLEASASDAGFPLQDELSSLEDTSLQLSDSDCLGVFFSWFKKQLASSALISLMLPPVSSSTDVFVLWILADDAALTAKHCLWICSDKSGFTSFSDWCLSAESCSWFVTEFFSSSHSEKYNLISLLQHKYFSFLSPHWSQGLWRVYREGILKKFLLTSQITRIPF